jgi:glycosyltransferase involved in cell wall biosynthesis
VITSGPPHICHIMGWVIHKVARRRWIVDYRDLWTDDPTHCPHSGYKLQLFKRIERSVIKNADAVVTVSPSWRDHLRTKFRREKQPDRFVLIRNGFNLDDMPTTRPSDHRPTKRIHIHSSGTPQPLAATVALLDALGKIKASSVNHDTLPLITFTGMSDQQRQDVISRQLDDCVVDVGAMSRQKSIDYCLKCDVLLVVVNNDNMSRKGTIPAKTYEAMALGCHILAIVPSPSDVTPLLTEYGNATICNVEDTNDIYQGLLGLVQAHNAGALVSAVPGEESRDRFLSKYSRASQARQLISLIEVLSQTSVEPVRVED